jgi:hypothetical protein
MGNTFGPKGFQSARGGTSRHQNTHAQDPQAKSLSTGRLIRYGVIDGSDSARVVSAYPKAFGDKAKP